MLNTKYKLTLAKSYVSSWDVFDAIRELLQNAIDSDSEPCVEVINSEKYKNKSVLRISNQNTSLPPKTLLLGITSKSDKADSIGQFGEGYKLALLVLTRCNYDVTIINGQKIWSPRFEYDKTFEEDVLCVVESKGNKSNKDLIFEVDGLAEHEVLTIIKRCRLLQDVNQDDIIETKYGQILHSEPGRLYVGGLYVCNTEMSFGYDVLPKYIDLERDRQTVSSWDLKQLAKDMWFDSDQTEFVVELLKRGIPDLEYANWGMPQLVKEACYRAFKNKHPDAVVAKNQEELDNMVRRGFREVIIIDKPQYHYGITTSESYQSEIKLKSKTISPEDELRNWLKQHKSSLHGRNAIVDFKIILEKSKHWRII